MESYRYKHIILYSFYMHIHAVSFIWFNFIFSVGIDRYHQNLQMSNNVIHASYPINQNQISEVFHVSGMQFYNILNNSYNNQMPVL